MAPINHSYIVSQIKVNISMKYHEFFSGMFFCPLMKDSWPKFVTSGFQISNWKPTTNFLKWIVDPDPTTKTFSINGRPDSYHKFPFSDTTIVDMLETFFTPKTCWAMSNWRNVFSSSEVPRCECTHEVWGHSTFKERYIRLKCSLLFNSTCLKEGILPTYTNMEINTCSIMLIHIVHM